MSPSLKTVQRILQWSTLSLGLASAALIVQTVSDADTLQGRLLPVQLRRQIPWKTIGPADMIEGVALPPHTNVLLHIPVEGGRLVRKVLFGAKGTEVRYWGYCFPLESTASRLRAGFPGTIFLSEKERAVRESIERTQRRTSIRSLDDLTEDVLNEAKPRRGLIRHQQELFQPGSTCYVMSEATLPVGIDRDDDELNSALEKEHQTNPEVRDTDGDGILDGQEVLSLGSNPRVRDSDGDGLVDGLEDRNRNGLRESGETDPTRWDTDRDGLCDGLCVVSEGGGGTRSFTAPKDYVFQSGVRELRGEDKNLNGSVDENETNPLLEDSDGDGINDEQEYFNCKIAKKKDC